MLPPESVAHRVVGPGADGEALDELARRAPDPPLVEDGRRCGSRRGARARGCRRPTGRARGSRGGPRGCGRRPRPSSRTGSGPGDAPTPPTVTDPPVGRRMPDSTSTSSVWPLPDTPATPRISPAATSSDTSRQRRQARAPVGARGPRSASTGVARGRGRARAVAPRRRSAGRPSSGRARARRSRRATVPTSAPRRRTVTRSLIARTSRELVADEDDRQALPATSGRRVANSASTSCGHEHGGGLVEDEDAAVARQRLEDLDPLLLARPTGPRPARRGRTRIPNALDAARGTRGAPRRGRAAARATARA